MEETVFDKIIRREIPAEIVYEDDNTLAFLSIEPIHKGHTIVIPKTRCRNIFDASPEVIAHVYTAAKHVAEQLRTNLGADGVNIHTNNEPAANQVVMYFHTHVIPRYADKHPFHEPKHEVYGTGEMAEYGQKLRG